MCSICCVCRDTWRIGRAEGLHLKLQGLDSTHSFQERLSLQRYRAACGRQKTLIPRHTTALETLDIACLKVWKTWASQGRCRHSSRGLLQRLQRCPKFLPPLLIPCTLNLHHTSRISVFISDHKQGLPQNTQEFCVTLAFNQCNGRQNVHC